MSNEDNGVSIASERFGDLLKELSIRYPDYKAAYDSIGELTPDNKPTINQLIACVAVSLNAEGDSLTEYIKDKLSEASNYFSYEEIDPESLATYNKAILSKISLKDGVNITDVITKEMANSVAVIIGSIINKTLEDRQIEGLRQTGSGSMEDVARIGMIKKYLDEGKVPLDIDITPLVVSKFFGSRSAGWKNSEALMNRRNEILSRDKDSSIGYIIARVPFSKDNDTGKIYSEYKGKKFEVKNPSSGAKIIVYTTVLLKDGSRVKGSTEKYERLTSGEANIAITHDNKGEPYGFFISHPNSVSKYYGAEYSISDGVLTATATDGPFIHAVERYNAEDGKIISVKEEPSTLDGQQDDLRYVDISKVGQNIKEYVGVSTLKRVMDYFEVPVNEDNAEKKIIEKFLFDGKYAKLRNKLMSSPGSESHKEVLKGGKKISVEKPIVYNAITDPSIIQDLKKVLGDKVLNVLSNISVLSYKSRPAAKTAVDAYLASSILAVMNDEPSILYKRIKDYVGANDKNAKKIAKNQLQSAIDAYIVNGHVNIEEDADTIKPYQAKEYDKQLIKNSFSDSSVIGQLLADNSTYNGDVIQDYSNNSETVKSLTGDVIGKTKDQLDGTMMSKIKKLVDLGVITEKIYTDIEQIDKSAQVMAALTDVELDEALYYIMANIEDNILYSIPERREFFSKAARANINEGEDYTKKMGTVVYVNDGSPIEQSKILRTKNIAIKMAVTIDNPELKNLVHRILNAMKVYMNNMGVGVIDRGRVIEATKDLINDVLAGTFTFDEWLSLNKTFNISITDDDIDKKIHEIAKESFRKETSRGNIIVNDSPDQKPQYAKRLDAGLAALDKLPIQESDTLSMMKTLLEGSSISDEERAAIEEYLKLYPDEEILQKDSKESLFYSPENNVGDTNDISKEAWDSFVKDVESGGTELPASPSARVRALDKIHASNAQREKLEKEKQRLRIEITKALNDRRKALKILVDAGKIKADAASLAMKNAIRSLPGVASKLDTVFKDDINLGWDHDEVIRSFISFGRPENRDRFYARYGGSRLVEE